MFTRLIIILALASLACGMQLPADTQGEISADVKAPSTEAEVTSVVMVVTAAKALNYRNGAGDNFDILGQLKPGAIVTCKIPFTVIGYSTWCKHSKGWSNTRWMKAKETKGK